MASKANFGLAPVPNRASFKAAFTYGVEGGAHGHRRLLGQPRGRVFCQVAQVELLGVLFPEGHGRIAEGTWCLHGNLLVGARVGVVPAVAVPAEGRAGAASAVAALDAGRVVAEPVVAARAEGQARVASAVAA